jgi:hypothetical protein
VGGTNFFSLSAEILQKANYFQGRFSILATGIYVRPVFLNLFESAALFFGKINSAAHLGINKGKK